MDNSGGQSKKLLRALVFSVAASLAATYLYENLVPWLKKRRAIKAKGDVLTRLGRQLRAAQLSTHESMVVSQVIDPEDIDVTFADVGGHDALIAEMTRVTLLPLRNPQIKSSLISPARGVLLYGPPGTGKTMLAKAIAKESGLAFINLDFSECMNKFVGESEKLISAVFSLAEKLAPSMLFVDEIDCYMRKRSATDHEFTSQMKATFMSCWDGFSNQGGKEVIVIAATNRPDTIDPAILRRLPIKLEVGLPSLKQREEILRKVLKSEELDESIRYDVLANATEGFSGDDLTQVCKLAAMRTLKEEEGGRLSQRPIGFRDLLLAVRQFSQPAEVSF